MDLIIDIVLVGLLIAVIIRMHHVSQQVASVKDMDAQIAPVLKELSQTLTQSSRHVEAMKQTAESLIAQLSSQVNKAQTLKSDFDFLLSHGDRVAERLENVITTSRDAKPLNEGVQEPEILKEIAPPKPSMRSENRKSKDSAIVPLQAELEPVLTSNLKKKEMKKPFSSIGIVNN